MTSRHQKLQETLSQIDRLLNQKLDSGTKDRLRHEKASIQQELKLKKSA